MPAPRATATPFRVRALAAALALVLALVAGVAMAQPRANPFLVRDVAVDVTATGAVAPRDAALAEAQRRAAQRLFERLVPRDQLGRVPRLTGTQLADLVDTVELQSERIVGARWIGAFAVGFRAAGVRDLLTNAGIPFAETTARPLLIVPVLAPAGAPPTLGVENPWLAAWRAMPAGDGLQPWIVVKGDAADLAELPPAALGDERRLAAIARRYGTSGVAVVTARPEPGAVTVSVLRRAGAGEEETLVDAVAARAGESQAALLARAAAEAARRIEERWKASVVIGAGSEGRLVARVPLRRLADWVAVRTRLAELPMVRRVSLTSLTRERAVIEVEYAGDEAALRAAMGERALTLVPDEPGAPTPWRIDGK